VTERPFSPFRYLLKVLALGTLLGVALFALYIAKAMLR
jgi:hypothetical protein